MGKSKGEIKNEYLEWQYNMLDVAMTCLRMYKITKDERFFELYKDMKKEADKWQYEANGLGAL